MLIVIILSASVLLQVLAAVLALRLIRATQHSSAWLCIATAIFLMSVRRGITLSRLIGGGLSLLPDLAAEIVALIISIFMVIGIAWIEPLFKGARPAKKSTPHSSIPLIIAIMFALLSVLVLANEIFDLPHILFNARATPINWQESLIEVIFIVCFGVFVVAKISKYITDNEEKTNILRATETKYRHTLDDMLEGCQVIGYDWRYLYINEVAEIHNRRDKEELLGQKYMDMWPGIESTNVFTVIRRCMDERMPQYMENEFAFPDGGKGWFELKIYPVPEGIVILSIDITKSKEAEDQITKARMFLDRSLSSAPDGVFLIDKEGRFTYANPIFLNMIGYGEEEIVGKTIQEIVPKIVPPESATIIQERANRRLQTGEQIIGVEVQLINKNKKITPISYSAAGIQDAEGKIIGEVVFLRDITERKQVENRLHILNKYLEQRTLDLERSNKDLEQFAYVASHDLQEPLRMVSSYTQLLEQRYTDQLDQDAKDFINFAVDGANRMQRLINDLLTYSRLGTRGKPFEPTDCHSVLGQVLVNLDKVIQENHALITNDDMPTIMADDTQLTQLFQNLIGNAIKFRRKEQPRIHISATEKDNECLFSVRDNGIGIEPEYKDRVFVIFQRLHSKDKYPGTGMGLAICKKIVERHGGRIWFDSIPGKGSTFHFTIPKKEV